MIDDVRISYVGKYTLTFGEAKFYPGHHGSECPRCESDHVWIDRESRLAYWDGPDGPSLEWMYYVGCRTCKASWNVPERTGEVIEERDNERRMQCILEDGSMLSWWY